MSKKPKKIGTVVTDRRKPKIDALTIRRVALDALVDERTLRRMLAGGAVRSTSRARIEKTMRKRGLLRFMPAAG